jgi:ubiquinone biosynthesis protein UbiJ
MPAAPIWLAATEAMLNRNIQAETDTSALARRLDGKSLQIDITGFARLRANVCAGRLVLVPGDDSPTDALIAGSPSGLLQLLSGDAQRAVGSSGVQVRGDAEVAAAFRELLTQSRPDFEEELARIVGDVPARRLSRLARGGFAWLRRTGRYTGENIAEYLQEESRVLVSKPELEEFLQAVDAVREASDRIEARVRRLEQRLRSGA